MNISKKMNFCLAAALLFAFAGNASETKEDKFKKIQKYCIEKLRRPLPMSKGVNAVAFSPDGESVIAGCKGAGENLKEWDVNKGTLKHALEKHGSNLRSVICSSRYIVSCSDNNIIVWNRSNGTLKFNIEKVNEQFLTASLSPDEKFISAITQDFKNNFMIFSAESGKKLNGDWESLNVSTASFSPNSKTIAFGGLDKKNILQLWKAEEGYFKLFQNFQGHQYVVDSIAFEFDGKAMASSSYGNKANLFIYFFYPEMKSFELNGHNCKVESVIFSPDGKRLASYDIKGNIMIWNCNLKNLFYNIGLHGICTSIAFSSDSKFLICGYGKFTNNLKIFDLDKKGEVCTLDGHDHGGISSIAFNKDNMISGSLGNENNCFLWDMRPLKWVMQELNNNQIDFLYQLCMKKEKDRKIFSSNSPEAKQLSSLPDAVKQVMLKVFNVSIAKDKEANDEQDPFSLTTNAKAESVSAPLPDPVVPQVIEVRDDLPIANTSWLNGLKNKINAYHIGLLGLAAAIGTVALYKFLYRK